MPISAVAIAHMHEALALMPCAPHGVKLPTNTVTKTFHTNRLSVHEQLAI
jgi:hypothetical protein